MAKLRRIDIQLESEGVWDRHPDGWAVKVRSGSSPRVTQALAVAMAKRLGELGGDSLPTEEAEKVLREVYAREVLCDWSEIGEAPEFSVELAIKFMADPELRGFQDHVARAAHKSEAFERKGVEAILKN